MDKVQPLAQLEKNLQILATDLIDKLKIFRIYKLWVNLMEQLEI
jgi:hypothetical protein